MSLENGINKDRGLLTGKKSCILDTATDNLMLTQIRHSYLLYLGDGKIQTHYYNDEEKEQVKGYNHKKWLLH